MDRPPGVPESFRRTAAQSRCFGQTRHSGKAPDGGEQASAPGSAPGSRPAAGLARRAWLQSRAAANGSDRFCLFRRKRAIVRACARTQGRGAGAGYFFRFICLFFTFLYFLRLRL